jgi:transcription elongation factor Elf1
VAQITRTATFDPTDPLPRILEDLACPACGHQDPGLLHARILDNRVRMFCEGCGTFVTFEVTEDQARVVRESAL